MQMPLRYWQKSFRNCSDVKIVTVPLLSLLIAFVTAAAAVQTSEHKSVKEAEPPAHLVDDMDFMEAGNVEVAHGPFAAHVDKSGISVQQVTCSRC